MKAEMKAELIQSQKVEEFQYKIDDEGQERTFTILFSNGKFSKCSFKFDVMLYTRNQWKILAKINDIIYALEIKLGK